MQQALALAQEAAALGEVPVGAVAVFEGRVVGTGYNRREIDRDPLAHAEVRALDQAARTLGCWRRSIRDKIAGGSLAEREGFEPSIRFPVYTLSKRAP